MVSFNEGYVNGDNPSNDNHQIDEAVIAPAAPDTDSDSDNAYNDYEPLPLHEDMGEEDNSSSDSSDSELSVGNEDGGACNNSLPSIERADVTLARDVWSAPPAASRLEMDSNRVDEVKRAMAAVTLPPSAIPEWATSVPEEQWRQQLLSRLESMQKR